MKQDPSRPVISVCEKMVTNHVFRFQEGNHSYDSNEAAGPQSLPLQVPAVFSGRLQALPSPHGLNHSHGVPVTLLYMRPVQKGLLSLGLLSTLIPPNQGGGLAGAQSSVLVAKLGQHSKWECARTSGLWRKHQLLSTDAPRACWGAVHEPRSNIFNIKMKLKTG